MSTANAMMPEMATASGGENGGYVAAIVLLSIFLFVLTVAALGLACVAACNGSVLGVAAVLVGFGILLTLGIKGVVKEYLRAYFLPLVFALNSSILMFLNCSFLCWYCW